MADRDQPGPLGLQVGDRVHIPQLGLDGEVRLIEQRAVVPLVVLAGGRLLILHLHDVQELR